MRILHILNYVYNVGNGVVNAAVDLACSQARSGEIIGMASAGGEYEWLLAQHGVQHFQLKQSGFVNFLSSPFRFFQIVNQFQPDLIHVHMIPGIILSSLLRWTYGYSLVSTVHTELQKNAILMGLADRMIAVSQAVASSMIHRGVATDKIRVVTNGTLGSPRVKSKAEYSPVDLAHPAITTVAGMYIHKGIADLIDAFICIAPEFEKAHLYLVGYGDDIDQFKTQAANCIFNHRIHFEGFQSNPQSYLLSTDIFVLASHKDSAPLVIPEAREMGCAIIGSMVDGIPELLDHGKAGYLVPSHNSAALADALRKLLNDPHEIKLWQQRSQTNLSQFKVERVCRETLDVYKELITTH